MPMKEPRPASYWKVVLNGSENAGLFREVSIGSSKTQVIDYKSTDQQGNPFTRRVPGINETGNITLVRGIDNNKTLWDWRQKVIDKGVTDPSTRCDGTIMLLDHDNATIAAFTFLQGWPASIDYGNVNSAGTDIAVEKVEIAHEGVKRIQ